ncbi:MAG: ATP-binding protein [Endomicrobiia bacterium]
MFKKYFTYSTPEIGYERDRWIRTNTFLLNRGYLFFLLIGLIPLFFLLLRSIEIGWNLFFSITVLVYISFFILYLFRNKISLHIKAGIFIIGWTVWTVYSLYSLGLSSMFTIIMIFLAILINILYGLVWSYITAFVGFLILIIFGILFKSGLCYTNIDLNIYNQNISSWLNVAFGFLVIYIIIIHSLHYIQKEYASVLQEIQLKNKSLGILNERFKKEIKEKSIIEQELLKSKENLEQLVFERTKTLEETNQKLQEEINIRQDIQTVLKNTNKELQQTIITKDKLMSIVAHDLKNPLNAIINIAEILKTKKDNLKEDKKDTFFKLISDSAFFAYNLLDNLLVWARSQTGSLEFKPEWHNLHGIIKKLVDFYETMGLKKEVNILCSINKEISIFVDVNMFETMIRNLLSNAIKYSHARSNVLLFSEEDENYIYVIVKDTGIGMDENVRNIIFNQTSKISLPGTEGEEGTGLGLLITDEFMKRHNGFITVESIKGVGTKFALAFPKKQA